MTTGKRTFKERIYFIKWCVLLVACILVYKLYIVQILNGDVFAAQASRQYVRYSSQTFDRGSIFFRTKSGGLVSGAGLKQGNIIAINPTLIKEPEAVYAALSEHIPLNRDAFLKQAARPDDPYEEVARRIESDTAEKISKLDLEGVSAYRETWRYYPGDFLASHVLGFVGWSGNVLSGRYGLERYYDDVLGHDEGAVYVNFFAELFSNVRQVFAREPDDKGDIVTTIEPTVQAALETELKAVADAWGSKEVGGVILDPQTGDIFALAAYPDYNSNEFQSADPAHFSNPIVEKVYEFGSIIKPLTVAAGIDAGAITPESTYTDTGTIVIDGARISNYDKRARGLVSMQDVLNQSLNTGVAHVVREMGKDSFARYMKSLKFGEETGIDLPGEVRGLTDNLDSPRLVEHVTASFGQGIATTPIAAVRALSALGNGGMLPEPHIVERIDYGPLNKRTIARGAGERVFKQETSEDITRMLVSVVDDALAGGGAALPHHSIAAKTGTAQIADPQNGGYYEDRFLHSFFGYFPAYKPQFIVFLFAVEPQGAQYASQTLTDPFMSTAKFLINYYDVAPDR